MTFNPYDPADALAIRVANLEAALRGLLDHIPEGAVEPAVLDEVRSVLEAKTDLP